MRLGSPLAAIAAAALVAVGTVLSGQAPVEPVHAATAKPNIVVFYLDDVAPHDGRLWSDPELTPTIYDRFVAHGVHFPSAIGETPLCCPARATLMTGLHTHNHGVAVNDVALFNPGETVATELSAAGYATMLIGKYLNKSETLSETGWEQHSAGWSVFDAFMTRHSETTGYFTGYTLFTKDGGPITPDEHSTQMIAERSVMRMAATDPEKPIFAVLSIVDTHLPNIPMAQFADDSRCDSMPAWNPPNYNEADVSDKPNYVSKLALLPETDGWPMVAYCKEMLGVDWLVGQVTDELAAEGRLDNTLLVFTADNGMDWGSHRLTLKDSPYSTPVPLYFSWPARWGSDPRTIDQYTSNIDLAPTFCAYGGCTLGPFPGGQSGPDGLSLKPLLEGTATGLGRDALLETGYRIHPFAAIRTTDDSDLGLWHSVDYANGFRELYNVDPDEDPFELDNLAYDPIYSDIRAELADRLLELLAEGRPEATASITISQDSLPNNKQDFEFSGDLGSFMLDDDSDATLPRELVFADLAPGSYAFRQAVVPGWSLVSLSCPPGSQIDVAAGRVTVNLLAGYQVTCTFRNAGRRPDASVALVETGPFKGDNVYGALPTKRQTQRWDGAGAGQVFDFFVGIQNDSSVADSFTVQSTETGSGSIAIAYLVGGVDVTAEVTAGTYTVSELAPGAAILLVMRVSVAPDAPTGLRKKVVVRQSSLGDPTRVDAVRASVTR